MWGSEERADHCVPKARGTRPEDAAPRSSARGREGGGVGGEEGEEAETEVEEWEGQGGRRSGNGKNCGTEGAGFERGERVYGGKSLFLEIGSLVGGLGSDLCVGVLGFFLVASAMASFLSACFAGVLRLGYFGLRFCCL